MSIACCELLNGINSDYRAKAVPVEDDTCVLAHHILSLLMLLYSGIPSDIDPNDIYSDSGDNKVRVSVLDDDKFFE